MRKNNSLVCIIIVLIFIGCKSTNQQNEFSYSDRLNMVIEDYYRKDRIDFKKHNLFSVDCGQIKDKYYFYEILPMRERSYHYNIDSDPKRSYLPSDYIKYRDKVFFVQDENVSGVKKGLLEYLDSMQLLDSTDVKLQLGMIEENEVELRMDVYDDALEGVTYIICKKEPGIIRKSIRTSTYIPPDDKRFENLCE